MRNFVATLVVLSVACMAFGDTHRERGRSVTRGRGGVGSLSSGMATGGCGYAAMATGSCAGKMATGAGCVGSTIYQPPPITVTPPPVVIQPPPITVKPPPVVVVQPPVVTAPPVVVAAPVCEPASVSTGVGRTRGREVTRNRGRAFHLFGAPMVSTGACATATCPPIQKLEIPMPMPPGPDKKPGLFDK